MTIVEFFGTIALITTLIGISPQVYKTYKTKSAGDISYLMLYNFLICSIAWTVYGFYTEAGFVLYSNILSTVVCTISIIQKYHYDHKQASSPKF